MSYHVLNFQFGFHGFPIHSHGLLKFVHVIVIVVHGH
nr:MAG TPA: hypothetical protein [Caudoviricetes sp.]